ncbi:MAG: hypothetical protein ACF8R9_04180 [Phycisphaerales bacterium JB054]
MKRYIGLGVVACFGAAAAAGPVFEQGFEVDASGWLDNDDYAGYGQVNRVASNGGTLGVSSFNGGFHAEFGNDGDSSAAFTRFDGYRTAFGNGFVAENSVYLDVNAALGSGFDYSVAANGQDNAHKRDFIFHVTRDSDDGILRVAGSNNTNFAPREDLGAINHYEVTTSGWYTLQHVFRNDGGVLAVDLNLVDALGNVLWTETRSDGSDIIATVIGGNRYGWFTHITDMTVAVDDTTLTLTIIPLPTAAGLTLAGLGLVGTRRYRSLNA